VNDGFLNTFHTFSCSEEWVRGTDVRKLLLCTNCDMPTILALYEFMLHMFLRVLCKCVYVIFRD
jgi:hypothetical protein